LVEAAVVFVCALAVGWKLEIDAKIDETRSKLKIAIMWIFLGITMCPLIICGLLLRG
jgi:hypothetical protein